MDKWDFIKLKSFCTTKVVSTYEFFKSIV
jgi:hypothetical protein